MKFQIGDKVIIKSENGSDTRTVKLITSQIGIGSIGTIVAFDNTDLPEVKFNHIHSWWINSCDLILEVRYQFKKEIQQLLGDNND